MDELNAEFYGQIRYPWPPQYFERVKRADLGGLMLAQDIGHWGARILPEEARIWVAGCGTNQALFTALRFPHARVLGSDLSAESLAACAENAASLGIANLELRRESINQVRYSSRFDYVICTGVIHHNADPLLPLSRLAGALKPEGLLELMVYNQYHRILSSAFQNAVRGLLGNPSRPDLARELPVARRLIASLRGDMLMPSFLGTLAGAPDAAFADTLLQPVEHSFTVGSLAEAARRCDLEMLTFCQDSRGRGEGETEWNLGFGDEHLDPLYLALSDVERWHITNLLMAESSPLLWFYLQRLDCPRPRKPERQICEEFLDRRFVRVKTEREIFTRLPDAGYSRSPRVSPYPGEPRQPLARRIAAELDEAAPLRETLRRLGIEPTFVECNRLRLNLATSSCPYLEAA
ncbi:MAG TPA: class I SAM-dependent methyltransferase [Thermoanaerobaculia bacterium]|nr:class I SAM-dependent methyltransferase [Thermoanaerobaculia bacterium]